MADESPRLRLPSRQRAALPLRNSRWPRAPAEAVRKNIRRALSLTSSPEKITEPTGSTVAGQAGWIGSLPGLYTLRRYEAAWLSHDVVAGLVLTTMLIPV